VVGYEILKKERLVSSMDLKDTCSSKKSLMKYLTSTFISALLVAAFLLSNASVFAQDWQVVSADSKNDVMRTDWADCTKMEYAYDDVSDEISFRFKIANMSPSIAADFGINVMVNIEGSSSGTFKFWGTNNRTDKFHYILTAWVTGTAPSNYTGTIGVANATGAKNSIMNNLHAGNLDLVVDETEGTIMVTVARDEFIPDSEVKGAQSVNLKIAGATGNSMGWNDDVYNSSKTIELSLGGTVGTTTALTQSTLSIFPNPTAGQMQVSGLSTHQRNSHFVILNQMGQQVQSGILQNATVNVTALPKGVFYIRMTEASTPLRFVKI